MYAVIAGFAAGALAGVIMGFLSHILFKGKKFKSSLILVDGSFFARSLKLKAGYGLLFFAGLVIHLVTSGVFGAIYVALVTFLFPSIPLLSPGWIGLYVALLWLAMLFVALPVAGVGFLGSKAGSSTWLEQLVLHIVFYGLYWFFLSVMG